MYTLAPVCSLIRSFGNFQPYPIQILYVVEYSTVQQCKWSKQQPFQSDVVNKIPERQLMSVYARQLTLTPVHGSNDRGLTIAVVIAITHCLTGLKLSEYENLRANR